MHASHQRVRVISTTRDGSPAFAVPGAGTLAKASAWGFHAKLNSDGDRIANQLSVAFGGSDNHVVLLDPGPGGSVDVAADTTGTAVASVPIWIAGGGSVAGDLRESTMVVSDVLVGRTSDGKHRWRIGGELGLREHVRSPSGPQAHFRFFSLADLEHGRPSLYTLTPGNDGASARQRRTTVYIDDRLEASVWTLVYGMRVERLSFSGLNARDPNASAPAIQARWTVSPRFGFVRPVQLPWAGRSRRTIELNGGFGRFVGNLPLAGVAAIFQGAGGGDGADLICVGPTAPAPDWTGLRRGEREFPTTCADGTQSFVSHVAGSSSFSPGFAPPEAWRASLGVRGVAWGGAIISATVAAIHGTNQTVGLDRNLRPEPRFRLQDGDQRPVYASIDGIDPRTGIVTLGSSRIDPSIGLARELSADGRSSTLQVTLSAHKNWGKAPRFGNIDSNVGYTGTVGTATASPLPSLTDSGFSTAGDPRLTHEARTANTPTHSLFASLMSDPSPGHSLRFLARWSSGTRFTPMVSGDVNGDGSINDRAFVYDPRAAGPDSAVTAGLSRLLVDGPSGVHTCLQRQLGRIAAHNSCVTPGRLALDLEYRVEIGRRIAGTGSRRIAMWLSLINLTAGLDRVVHGHGGLRGWGQMPTPDSRLLAVRGFDPEALRFVYDVNPRFGSSWGGRASQAEPFTVSVQGRVVVGSDRPLADFRAASEAARNRSVALTPANLRRHYEDQIPNFPAEVLAMNLGSGLQLTFGEALALRTVADSLRDRLSVVAERMVEAAATGGGARGDPLAPFRSPLREAADIQITGLVAVQSILSDAQWYLLPRSLRIVNKVFAPYPATEQTGSDDY